MLFKNIMLFAVAVLAIPDWRETQAENGTPRGRGNGSSTREEGRGGRGGRGRGGRGGRESKDRS
jgi:hypothetical protein